MRILVYQPARSRGLYVLDGSPANIAVSISLLGGALDYVDITGETLPDPNPESWRVEAGELVYSPSPSPAHRLDANGDWVLPRPTIPTVVTMRQARLALHGAGLLGLVDAAVEAIPGPAGEAARIEWEYALSVERGSTLVASMAAAIPLTEGELDALFTAADAL